MLAGGPDYFLNAYINCKMLREMGCTLPIEWFYMGDEMKPEWLQKIADNIPNVTCIDLHIGQPNNDNTKARGGWQNKVVSIIKSSFDQVLFLDADCFPLKDPTYLFDDDFFKATGCVLWPDPYCWQPEKHAFLKEKFQVPGLPIRQVESGQMMFTKSRCLEGLNKVRELNENHADTYTVLYGDKDTFLIGMLQANADFKVAPYGCDGVYPVGMCHKDFQGNRLLLHLAGGKWRKHGRPMVTETEYPMRSRVLDIVKDLKPLLIS